jgi:sulfate-transporting ATPase
VKEIIGFGVSGLGAGGVYALSALGIVLIYRGSGVLNFANGAVGAAAAFIDWDLVINHGQPKWVGAIAGLATAAVLGFLIHFLVMNPLRHKSGLVRIVATLGVLTVIQTVILLQYTSATELLPSLLPQGAIKVFSVSVGEDRVYILVLTFVLTGVLTFIYRKTKFGYATTAIAENQRAGSALGLSPSKIAGANWILGSMLAGIAGIIVAPLVTLQAGSLTALVIPALAAAMIGNMSSFGLTVAGGLFIGVTEALVIRYAGAGINWSGIVPFAVFIVVMVVRGSNLPIRGERTERRAGIGSGVIRPLVLLVWVAIAVVLIEFVLHSTYIIPMITTLSWAVIILSLVVLTGYTGQLSLAQMALAGVGGFVAAKVVINWGFSLELAILAAIVAAVALGLIIGLTALRTRGVTLAVVTMGFSVVAENLILTNPKFGGGALGLGFVIGNPHFFGLDVSPSVHPQRYALMCLFFFVVIGCCVANLRRGRSGRRLLAVRSNERAAAASGISVRGAKLAAFAISGGIAAVGGVLLSFQTNPTTFESGYDVFQSIQVVISSVLGGVGYIVGAIQGALFVPGTLIANYIATLTNYDPETGLWLTLFGGIVLLRILMVSPDGIIPMHLHSFRNLGRKLRLYKLSPFVRREIQADLGHDIGELAVHVVSPKTLRIEGITVRFGGVVALNDFSAEVRPGEVMGLLGPNGAGKTTAVDAISGYVKPAGGSVYLDDVCIDRWSPTHRARSGIVRTFQSLELFDDMTVLENLLCASEERDSLAYFFDLFRFRTSKRKLSPAALAAIRAFELEEFLERKPPELPFGKRRLVGIARAVAMEPSVLLLDEPAAGLNDFESQEMGTLIRQLAESWQMAVLLIEHNVEMILGVSDHVVALDFGNTIARGTPQEIRANDLVVAAYLGGEGEIEEITVEADPTSEREAPRVHVVSEPSPDDLAAAAAAVDGTVRGDPLLAGKNLEAGYDGIAVVRNVNIEVYPGEVVALLGPNGAGKTTTLLTLAGDLKPLGGEVHWQGQKCTTPLHKRARQGLSLVTEERSVFMSLTCEENLKLGRGTVDDAIATMPVLDTLRRRRAGLMSGGEQQILTLARAVAAKPAVLVADELSLGLAPLVVSSILKSVRSAADDGLGVLLVEQQVRQALAIADRAYIMGRGEIVLQGTAEEISQRLAEVEDWYLSSAGGDGEAPTSPGGNGSREMSSERDVQHPTGPRTS